MATLYELTDEWRQLLEMAQDPDVDPQVIEDTMDALSGDFEYKADCYAKVIRQLKADAEAYKVEADRLNAKKQVAWNAVDRIQRRLAEAMIATGKTKFKTNLFSFGIQKNPASVVIDHPELVPDVYVVQQEPKFDKNAIKELLKSGDEVVCHFAHLESTESLRIR